MRFETIKIWFEKYERFFSPLAFIVGFTLDSLTLTRIDLWIDNAVLIAYILIAGAGILLTNAYQSGRERFRFLEPYALFLPLPIQYAFGGLFSGFFIFYSRSASLVSSWPFLAFLTFFLLGNEFFRRRYTRLVFQLSIFFIAVFSYSIFALPILFGKMGNTIFLLSGLASLGAIVILITLLSILIQNHIRGRRKILFANIGVIYTLFHIFYFTNIIPPIPLSLKEIGVYHSVIKNGAGEYTLLAEPAPKHFFFQKYSSIFHKSEDESVYVYSAIFAPGELTTKILHRWAYFDKTNDEWITTDNIPFPIIGGRDSGYRGFTVKQNVTAGEWRVDVITERGQLLGRVKFQVVPTKTPPDLKTIRS